MQSVKNFSRSVVSGTRLIATPDHARALTKILSIIEDPSQFQHVRQAYT